MLCAAFAESITSVHVAGTQCQMLRLAHQHHHAQALQAVSRLFPQSHVVAVERLMPSDSIVTTYHFPSHHAQETCSIDHSALGGFLVVQGVSFVRLYGTRSTERHSHPHDASCAALCAEPESQHSWSERECRPTLATSRLEIVA